MTEYAYTEDGSYEPISDDLESMLIAEEEAIEEYWSELAELVYPVDATVDAVVCESVDTTVDAACIDHLFN